MLRTSLRTCSRRLVAAIHTAVPTSNKWELTIGLEIHAELNTARKLFSEAATSFNEEPNTNVALFDLAYPGTQPHFQHETLLPALRAAIALNCKIARKSSFDRKHYFYQDQPAGYQITQYYEPFAKDGEITLFEDDGIAPEDGESITIGIKQIQMEQDTAKTIHQSSQYLLDFNRVSHPLIEVITLPHVHHPSTAAACVRKIQDILRSVNACTAGMEVGGLRADVNVSVRRRDGEDDGRAGHSYYGVNGLGQRTEIKNLSSFKAVKDAIIAERDRQIEVLEAGGHIEAETRGWSLGDTETKKLRGKEGEIDYRYLPDPDISPVFVSDELVEHLKTTLPKLPDELLNMLTTDPRYKLTAKDAKTLISLDEGDRLDYYMDVTDQVQTISGEQSFPSSGTEVGNWVLHELGGLFSKAEVSWSSDRLPSSTLAHIVSSVMNDEISRSSGKKLLVNAFESDEGDDGDIRSMIEEEKLLVRNLNDQDYELVARQLAEANPAIVNAIKEKGQTGKVMWFVGQVMKEAAKKSDGGSADPEKSRAAILKTLGLPPDLGKGKTK